jgi:methionine biosynthesis protein MetW
MNAPALDGRFSYEKIAQLVPDGASVLDLGCGNGELLQILQMRRRVRGRGVEINEEMIRACIEKGISVYQGDLDEGLAEYRTQSYDYVILNQTLQMVHDPVRLLEEMVRVGRHAIVNFPNFGYVWNRIQLAFGGRMPVNKDIPYQWYDTPNIHFCTRRDFVELCEKLRLNVERAIDLWRGRAVASFLANTLATQCCFVLGSATLSSV